MSDRWKRPMTTEEAALVLMILGLLLVVTALGLEVFDLKGGWA